MKNQAINFEVNRAGRILPSRSNLHMALLSPEFCEVELQYDIQTDEPLLTAPGTKRWRSFRETDYIGLCLTLERKGFMNIPVGRLRDMVALHVADQYRFGSIRSVQQSKA